MNKVFNFKIILLFILFTLLTSLFLYLSQIAYLSDSEILSISIIRESTHYGLGHYYKLLFSFILELIKFENPNDIEDVLNMRMIFGLIGVVNVGLTAYLYKVIFKNNNILFPILYLLGFTFFLERGFRIRADNLSLSIHLVFLILLFKMKSTKFNIENCNFKQVFSRFGYILIFEFLLVLISIKSIYIVFGLQILYLFWIWKAPLINKRLYLKLLLFKNLLILIVSLLLVLIFHYLNIHSAENLIFEAWNYLVSSIRGGEGMPPFFSKMSFQYVIRLLRENVLWMSIFYLPLVYKVSKIVVNKPNKDSYFESIFYLYVFILLILLLIFPEKYPFFIASFLPFFSIIGAKFFSDFTNLKLFSFDKYNFIKSNKTLLIGTIFVSISLTLILKHSYEIYKNRNNFEQINFIIKTSNFLNSLESPTYFDVLSLFPREKTQLIFAGPNQPKLNKLAINQLLELNPDYIFYTNKMGFFEPEISNLLNNNYIDLGFGIFVKGIKIQLDKSQFKKIIWNESQYYELTTEKIKEYLVNYPKAKNILKVLLENNIWISSFQNQNTFAATDSVLYKDKEGWISLYNKEGLLNELKGTLLIPESVNAIGVSTFPILPFLPSMYLMDLFSFDGHRL